MAGSLGEAELRNQQRKYDLEQTPLHKSRSDGRRRTMVRGRASGQAVSQIPVANITPAVYTPATPLRLADMFVDPLPLPQVLLPATAPDPGNSGALTDFYNVDVKQNSHIFSSKLPGPASVWGYAARPGNQATLNLPLGYLDGVILATKGKPVRINFQNAYASNPDTEAPDYSIVATARRPIPFLFSDSHIERLLAAAQQARPCDSLRPSEARKP